ncbi:MAG: hypothetical protein R8P61_27510 [Bacteroidia bacterium]|nr:hypothetical protein [Bacteroidia bacterium]
MDSIGQLQQIKEIIFGGEMNDLLARIDSLEERLTAQEKNSAEEMAQIKADFKADLEKAQADFNTQIEKVLKQLDQKTEKLESTQVKRKELGKLLSNLGEKFLKE